MTIDVAELRRLIQEATPGPWEVSLTTVVRGPGLPDTPVALLRAEVEGRDRACAMFRGSLHGENATLAAAAVAALPSLLDRLEALEAAIVELERELATYRTVKKEPADAV